MTREEALRLMQEHTKSASLRQHMLAVEAAMRGYAQQRGEDPDTWGIVGLLHDFDYEQFPNLEHSPTEGHPAWGVRLLREKGVPEAMCRAILGHGNYTGVPRTRRLRRRCSRWTSCAGSWSRAPSCGLPGASRISRCRR